MNITVCLIIQHPDFRNTLLKNKNDNIPFFLLLNMIFFLSKNVDATGSAFVKVVNGLLNIGGNVNNFS